MGRIQRAHHVQIDHRFPVVRVTLFGAARRCPPSCIGKDSIDLPELLRKAAHGLFLIVVLRGVAGQHQRLIPDLAREIFQLVFAAGEQPDVPAGLGSSAGGGCTDPA